MAILAVIFFTLRVDDPFKNKIYSLNIAITITIFIKPKNYTFGFIPTKGSMLGGCCELEQ